MKLLGKLKKRANGIKEKLKKEIQALVLAYSDDRTPWYAKALLLIAVAYAVSPIDLIPDFIPILGYLDDLIILPLLITLAVKLIPEEILKDCRKKVVNIKSADISLKFPGRTAAIIAVILLWLLIIGGFIKILFKRIY